jgi:hypothetical protein
MANAYYRDEPDTDSWPHGDMVDMAQTPEEIADKAEKMAAAPMPVKVPQYPYGLSISLCDDELEKLGLDMETNGELPEVGDILEFYATAKVTCASCIENVDAMTGQPKKCCRVELQIVGMAIHGDEPEYVDRVEEEEARSQARRTRFYGRTMTTIPSYDRD